MIFFEKLSKKGDSEAQFNYLIIWSLSLETKENKNHLKTYAPR